VCLASNIYNKWITYSVYIVLKFLLLAYDGCSDFNIYLNMMITHIQYRNFSFAGTHRLGDKT